MFSNTIIDTDLLFKEAQVLSSFEHLSAVFNVPIEALIPHRELIEHARLVSEHDFMKRLKLLMETDDKDAVKMWAEMIKLREMNKAAPISSEEQLNTEKVRDILLPQK